MNKILTILLCLFCGALATAQTIYQHDLDENKLDNLRNNIRHLSSKPERWTYDNEVEWEKAIKKYEKKNGNSKTNSDKETAYESPEAEQIERQNDNSFRLPQVKLGPIGKIILYVVLGGILVALIYLLFINSDFKMNGEKYVPLDIEEAAPADIPKTELERLLEAAMKRKDFREAIRIYYLFILKDLSEKQWIDWQKQKTNGHYVFEMRDKKEALAFSKIVNYFEFIWYGKHHINETQFRVIQPDFTSLLNTLNIK